MTQVEMPQLSLRRYVDLVKRRRWQVVPVSVLGLLVGGLIAFFIPRYFVAETQLLHQQLPGGAEDREDPFRQIVDTAKSSIPLFVGEAIDLLKWPEAQGLDEFARDQLNRSIEDRINVVEKHRGERNRSYATLRVQYRDQDGNRSADLLNMLVEVWMARRTEQLRVPAKERNREAKDRADRAWQTLQKYQLDKQNLGRQYGIDPSFSLSVQQKEYPKQVEDRKQKAKELADKEIARSRLAALVTKNQELLLEIPPRVAPESTLMMEQALKNPQAKELVPVALRWMTAYQNTLTEYTQGWYYAKQQYEFTMQQIQQLLPEVAVDPDGKIPNPKHVELRDSILKTEQGIAELDAEILLLRQASEQRQRDLDDLYEGYRLYQAKLDQIEEADRAREDALAEAKEAERVLTELTRQLPVEVLQKASVPPAPTEPNILIVALIGCVLGLGVAIGLILLFDVLQGSFKTLDDVERGLAVPVLGGVSHLETEQERTRAVRSRRRVSLVAAASVVLVSGVVLVFYWDPTRLPPVVRDILSMLLGT